MSERRRAIIRIGTNYFRLVATLVLGVYLVRLLWGSLGEDGFGLVALLTSTLAIAAVVEEIASWCMIRELGAALHGDDPGALRRMFNSALAICGIAAALLLPIFAAILLVLPLLEIKPELLPAARWFVVFKAIEATVIVQLAPQFNMYIVTERMAAYNFWLVARRATMTAAALGVAWFNTGDAGSGVILFGWLSSALQIVVIVAAAIMITAQDRRLLPHPGSANRADILAIVALSGWSAGIQCAQLLIVPLGAVFMNLYFGLFGNAVFDLAVRLGGYARMLASGMTVGLDAVAARLSTVSSEESLRKLLHYSTRLHGLVAFPAVIAIWVIAHPLLKLWVGDTVEDPETIDAAAVLTRVMLIGFCAMCISDCWTRILYGAGHVRRYARLVIAGAVATPALALALLIALPESISYTGVAAAFSLMYLIVHMILLPQLTARALGTRWSDVMRPLATSLAAALIVMPILLAAEAWIDRWSLVPLAAAAGGYAAAYSLATWLLVLTQQERQMIVAALLRRRRSAPLER